MYTSKKHKTIRNSTGAAAVALGIILLAGVAGAQEAAGGGANKDDHTHKIGMREMPRLKESGVVTVKGNENWNDMLGFGKESDMAEMMTLMMVAGSGMEHMKMAPMKPGMKMDKSKMGKMKMDAAKMQGMAKMSGMTMPEKKKEDAPAASGEKTPETAAQNKPKPDNTPPKPDTPVVAAIPIPAKTAAATDPTPAKATDDKAPAKAGETAKPASDKTPAAQTPGYQVMLNTPAKSLKIGKNMLDVTVLDPDGKSVVGAKVTAAVEMTSMDMGVTKPKAQEGKAGHYMSEVTFSMRGPWRVTMTVTPPKQKPFTKALDFNVPK